MKEMEIPKFLQYINFIRKEAVNANIGSFGLRVPPFAIKQELTAISL